MRGYFTAPSAGMIICCKRNLNIKYVLKNFN